VGSERGVRHHTKAVTIVAAFLLGGIEHAGDTNYALEERSTLIHLSPSCSTLCSLLISVPGVGAAEMPAFQAYVSVFQGFYDSLHCFHGSWLTLPSLGDGLTAGDMWLFEHLPVSLFRGLGLVDGERQ